MQQYPISLCSLTLGSYKAVIIFHTLYCAHDNEYLQLFFSPLLYSQKEAEALSFCGNKLDKFLMCVCVCVWCHKNIAIFMEPKALFSFFAITKISRHYKQERVELYCMQRSQTGGKWC